MAKKITNADLEIIGKLTITNTLNGTGDFLSKDIMNVVRSRTPVQVKSDIGMGNVDNTSDLNKPISDAVRTEFLKYLKNTTDTLTGDLTVTGTITGLNLSGTNTGDQDLSPYQLLSQKGSANGYTPLGPDVKIPIQYIPDALLGQVKFGGTYNGIVITASASFPELNGQPLPAAGSYEGVYFISTADFVNGGTSYVTGDWIISTGIAWTKVDNTDAVTSIFGRIGNVVALEGDYEAFYSKLGHTHTFASLTSKPTTIAGFGITDGYTKSETDGKYLLRTTDTLTGNLTVTNQINVGSNVVASGNLYGLVGVFNGGSGNALRIYGNGTGNSNVGYYSIYESNGSTSQGRFGFLSSSNSHFLIENQVAGTAIRLNESGGVNGLQFVDAGGTGTVWTSRNDGTGSGLDADVVQGLNFGVSGSWWNSILKVTPAGVTEVGRYLDFHATSGDTTDFTYRLDADGTTLNPSGHIRFGVNNRLELSTSFRAHSNGTNTYFDALSGDILIRDTTTNRFTFGRTTGNLTATGTMTATNFILSSDRRKKTKITPLKPVQLDTNWYSYEFKDQKGQKRYGVLADELKRTNPELVYTDDKGMMSVAYTDLFVLEIANLKEENRYLKESVEVLQDKLEILIENIL